MAKSWAVLRLSSVLSLQTWTLSLYSSAIWEMTSAIFLQGPHQGAKKSTTTSLEAIARNNLKMAGEDEVLILINDKDTNNIVEKEKNDKIRIKNIKGIFNNGRQ